MVQFPSGSASLELDKEFCVKNIPAHFVDWDLFRVFQKYGVVHNVKIPSKQLQTNTKYGFVIMENMNGADEVRHHLKNGKYLSLENGLQLLVCNVRHGDNQRSRDDGRGTQNESRSILKELCIRNDGSKLRSVDKPVTHKTQHLANVVRCFSQDLQLQTPTKVRVVDSPYPSKTVNEGFLFYVIPIDQKLGDEYACLQREMNKFCSRNPNLNEVPKVGQYVLYCRAAVAFRALCNSESTLYLIDMGETVAINRIHLWEMLPSFTMLPSLVIPCGIAGISWIKPTTLIFNNCRSALKQWSKSYSEGLTATAHEYAGLTNMVHLKATADGGVEEDFATSIAAKGLCKCMSHHQLIYSRDTLLEAKNAKASGSYPPISFSENIVEIVTGLQAVKVA